MTELVTTEQFSHWLALAAAGALVAGAVLGGARAAWRRQWRYLGRGLAWGLLGPLAWLLWLAYRWAVRLDPQTEYVGLYRPGVILSLVVAALVLGSLVGWALRRGREVGRVRRERD